MGSESNRKNERARFSDEMIQDRLRKVGFVEPLLKESFIKLRAGKDDEKQLAEYLDRAMDDLEKNEQAGINSV